MACCVVLIGLVLIQKILKSCFFDSFGGCPEKRLIQQIPKSITFDKYKIQDKDTRICCTYCLYFFDLIEKWFTTMVFYGKILVI